MKKQLLFSLLVMTAVTQVMPNDEITAQQNTHTENFNKAVNIITGSTMLGAAIGAATGMSIAFMADAVTTSLFKNINTSLYFYPQNKLGKFILGAHYFFNPTKTENYYRATKTAIQATHIATLFGCKYIWEKPLRIKVTNWIFEELKKHGIEIHEELAKTVSRVAAYVATGIFISDGIRTQSVYVYH